jgi:hypothetical protein
MVDYGAGFEPKVEVSDMRGAANGFLGDYKGIAVQGRDVLVLWTDTRNDMGDVYFARAKDGGRRRPTVRSAVDPGARSRRRRRP